MRNQLLENKEFNIISRKIDNAVKCSVVEICDDCFKVKLQNPEQYEKDESVELFAMTSKGQLYFETLVKDIQNDIISIWFPITYKYLQRREYSRINSEKEIILNINGKKITAKVMDISAGGLKISTKNQLELQKEYSTEIKVENRTINTTFEPIRIEVVKDYFISSGRFKDLTNYDRIALVQYCFRKQIENSNK